MNEESESETFALIDNIIHNIFYFDSVFAIIGILITIPHLVITTRKAMRTSNTNSLIIGIALCDLIVLSGSVISTIYEFINAPTPCNNQNTYLHVLWNLMDRMLRDTLIQTSFSLGLSLALIRLLVIKFLTRLGASVEYLTKTWTGYVLVVLLCFLNSIPTLRSYKTMEIVYNGQWKPYEECPELPVNYTEPAYSDTRYEHLEPFESYSVTRGMMQICISTIYPVLAFLLFFEIREAAKRAKRLSLQKFSDHSQTSRLVLILTVSFVISSTPLGICYFLQTSVTLSSLGVMIVGYGTIFCSCLFTINASTHAIICLTLSSEYRKTVRKVLRIAEKEITTDKIFTSRLD